MQGGGRECRTAPDGFRHHNTGGTVERVEILLNGYGAFGAYWELARLSDGRFIVWRQRLNSNGYRATMFDTETEAREYLTAYTTPVVEVL